MRRVNTASQEMIDDFKRLKEKGITDFIVTVTKPNGKWLKPQVRHTAYGVSKMANEAYVKYGDGTTVEVSYIDFNEEDLPIKIYCTYG